MLVLQKKKKTGPAEMYLQFNSETNFKSYLANQKKAGVPECKPDDLFFVVHSRKEESSTLIYH